MCFQLLYSEKIRVRNMILATVISLNLIKGDW